MQIHESGVKRNLATYGLFAASERLLMELGRKGANRQQMHELIRHYSLKAWAEVQEGEANTLAEMLSSDKTILSFMQKDEVLSSLNAEEYVGDAPARTRMVIEEVKAALN
jgi:adenylosuccinate lyase